MVGNKLMAKVPHGVLITQETYTPFLVLTKAFSVSLGLSKI